MPKKILLVDDDESMLSLYARIFTDTDYEIAMLDNFRAAAAKLEAEDFDLLITDYMFPDGVGTDLINLFSRRKAGAKSLLVTGSVAEPPAGKFEGMIGYFGKPFHVQNFLKAVAQALA
jgi:DNA-binding NtrC family response regulator